MRKNITNQKTHRVIGKTGNSNAKSSPLFKINEHLPHRNFAKYSLATIVGSENNAVTILAFLQISTECIRYNYDLRHRLEVQVLEWLCCPLAWYYESDSEAEIERIQHPVLRTLQETFICSATFKATCFPCSVKEKPWTLLHAVCTFVKKSTTVHSCSCSPKRERTWHIFRWAHNPWLWNETTNEYFYINNPPAEWKCQFFHKKSKKTTTGQLEKDGFWNQQTRNGVLS